MSWLERLPESFGAKHKMKLLTLFDTYLGATCGILRRTMHEPFPTVDGALLDSLLNLMDCEFYAFYPREGQENKSPEEVEQCAQHMEAIFFFAFIWSVCCTVRRPASLRCLHAISMNSLRRGRPWVVFLSNLSCFELFRTTRSPRTPERGSEQSSRVAAMPWLVSSSSARLSRAGTRSSGSRRSSWRPFRRRRRPRRSKRAWTC